MHEEWPPAATLHASGSAWGPIWGAFLSIATHTTHTGPKPAIDGCTRPAILLVGPLDFLSFRAGNQHMEYVHQRGAFDDMPLAQMVADFHAVYPKWMREIGAMEGADFHAEAAAEQRASAS